MCGIVGYVGGREALPILLGGLERLEYRGYDSCGVALAGSSGLGVWKTTGRVTNLRESIQALVDTVGIGHTRWATHGAPTEANAHPHTDAAKRVAVAHNGIIENHDSIRGWLGKEGIPFTSETDTEALAQLIGWLYHGDLEAAVRSALHEVEGAYGLVVVCA
ncbi:MAG: glutamine--fructose-6-phosphate aminotransferase, partial [Acidimicrobiia bacterium]